jgi:hypothetical protein
MVRGCADGIVEFGRIVGVPFAGGGLLAGVPPIEGGTTIARMRCRYAAYWQRDISLLADLTTIFLPHGMVCGVQTEATEKREYLVCSYLREYRGRLRAAAQASEGEIVLCYTGVPNLRVGNCATCAW